MKKYLPLQAMLEVAIFAALAMLIDLLPGIKLIPSISISLSMIPIFIVAFRWCVKASFISGFIWGILQIVTGDAWILTPLQAFIEYFVAFSFIGFAGLMMSVVQNAVRLQNRPKLITSVSVGVLIGSIGRYFWHFIAGVVFFANYAEEVCQTPIYFSFVTYSITMISSFIVYLIVIILILIVIPTFIKMNKTLEANRKVSYMF